jgi:hypothetical protein
MSLFRKIFGTGNDASNEESQSEFSNIPSSFSLLPVDEKFTYNFKKNGGKFLYCENLEEVNEQFLNILEENDWFECEAVCYEPKLFHFLDENRCKSNQGFFFKLSNKEKKLLFEKSKIATNENIKINPTLKYNLLFVQYIDDLFERLNQ